MITPSKRKTTVTVAIDPGLNNLLFCVDGDGKGRNHLRYTMDMRRSQSKTKKFGNILLRLKTESIEGKTVFELETELSEHNSKTLDFDGFKKYIINIVCCCGWSR